MKVNRLLEILTVLLQQESVTAPDLARRMEVSRRTIGRDIDDLCQAGIPVVTRQGAGGGISIAPGYRLDKSLLMRDELQNILIGLHGLDSVDAAGKTQRLFDKLTPRDGDVVSVFGEVVIDLASYYKESLSEKIASIRKAIGDNRFMEFDYYSNRGRQARKIAPRFVIFRWGAWYVFGYCLKRSDVRLFKLNRLWNLQIAEENPMRHPVAEKLPDFDACVPDENTMTVLFDSSVEYLVIETYGPESYCECPDGRLLFTHGYGNLDYTVSWILSFGSRAEVVAPDDLKRAVAEEVRKLSIRYSDSAV